MAFAENNDCKNKIFVIESQGKVGGQYDRGCISRREQAAPMGKVFGQFQAADLERDPRYRAVYGSGHHAVNAVFGLSPAGAEGG